MNVAQLTSGGTRRDSPGASTGPWSASGFPAARWPASRVQRHVSRFLLIRFW